MQTSRIWNRDLIKYIAIIAMLLDHIAWYLLPFASPAAQAFHVVGRITAPVMCFFIAEGYRYTHSVKTYALRLFLFAVASQIPWSLLHQSGTLSFNMLFSLFFGLLAVHAAATISRPALRLLAVAACIGVTYWCDWHFYAVFWCVLFYVLRTKRKTAVACYAGTAALYILNGFLWKVVDGQTALQAFVNMAFTFGLFLPVPLLLLYNGQKGHFKGSKWVFYLFYPLHLLAIALIRAHLQQG